MFKSPFTASTSQVATYLLGVALFSISFLVFLNSSVSFVISDLIGQKKHVGDAVGTLGFADEVVALIACPLWGIISDRLSTRNVITLGYGIVGLSLFVFVQARNVYPELLLGRLLFSVGGAATSTMVTAILPTMTTNRSGLEDLDANQVNGRRHLGHNFSESVSTDATVTPETPVSQLFPSVQRQPRKRPSRSASSQVAGLVGMFTGLGALIALGVFLPLPAWFQDRGFQPGPAVQASFYIVGTVAFLVAIVCLFGLQRLPGEENRGWRNFLSQISPRTSWRSVPSTQPGTYSFFHLFSKSVILGFTDISIGLGYLGGFVARASSVGISLFIPLYVHAYFISSGLCHDDPTGDPTEVKRQCRRAYTLAAALTGMSQVVALIGAPIFGWLDGRLRRFNLPILFASLSGCVGYLVLAQLKSPDPKDEAGGPGIFVVMALLGISQIGAIVCSLSLLSRGIDGDDDEAGAQTTVRTAVPPLPDGFVDDNNQDDSTERANLLPSHLQRPDAPNSSRSHLKGSIAGVYSLTGGAGIILLTKLGGYLFDSMSPGAPFYMLAIFNGILLVAVVACGILTEIRRNMDQIAL